MFLLSHSFIAVRHFGFVSTLLCDVEFLTTSNDGTKKTLPHHSVRPSPHLHNAFIFEHLFHLCICSHRCVDEGGAADFDQVAQPAVLLFFFTLTLPRPYFSSRLRCDASPELQTSVPLCLFHVPTPAARLQSSRSPYLDVPTPAAQLQSSGALEANPYTSLDPQHVLRTYFLRRSITFQRLPSADRKPHVSSPPRRPYPFLESTETLFRKYDGEKVPLGAASGTMKGVQSVQSFALLDRQFMNSARPHNLMVLR